MKITLEKFLEVITTLLETSPVVLSLVLSLVVALGAIGLACLSIWVVHNAEKKRGQ